MPILVNLDMMLVKRKLRSKDVAEAIGITEQNLCILKTGKAKAIRFSTLEAICRVLNCQPGDILVYEQKLLEPSSNSHNADDNEINSDNVIQNCREY